MASFTVTKEVEVDVDEDDFREYFKNLDRSECRELAHELFEDCAEGDDIESLATQLDTPDLIMTIKNLIGLVKESGHDQLTLMFKQVIDDLPTDVAGQVLEQAMNRFNSIKIEERKST